MRSSLLLFLSLFLFLLLSVALRGDSTGGSRRLGAPLPLRRPRGAQPITGGLSTVTPVTQLISPAAAATLDPGPRRDVTTHPSIRQLLVPVKNMRGPHVTCRHWVCCGVAGVSKRTTPQPLDLPFSILISAYCTMPAEGWTPMASGSAKGISNKSTIQLTRAIKLTANTSRPHPVHARAHAVDATRGEAVESSGGAYAVESAGHSVNPGVAHAFHTHWGAKVQVRSHAIQPSRAEAVKPSWAEAVHAGAYAVQTGSNRSIPEPIRSKPPEPSLSRSDPRSILSMPIRSIPAMRTHVAHSSSSSSSSSSTISSSSSAISSSSSSTISSIELGSINGLSTRSQTQTNTTQATWKNVGSHHNARHAENLLQLLPAHFVVKLQAQEQFLEMVFESLPFDIVWDVADKNPLQRRRLLVRLFDHE
ncbi:hypothetical protein EYF80_000632 [Liparis tanakae]|uniref:Uncharacterized protein n=1 Tax=Liparis tanakae TaxID=230148 RepID=A0A4Z2JHX1_9TELE|nr:hypothetical protein EYF80_000632 [Liparis tanakae]